MYSVKSHPLPPKRRGLTGIVVYAAGVCLVMLMTWLSPLPQAPVAVLVTPNSKAAFDVVEASGGHMISISGLPNLVIAQSGHPEFISRLYAHGALLVFNPQFLTGCQIKA